MKRYRIDWPERIVQDNEGDWVKAHEALEELERLKAEVGEAYALGFEDGFEDAFEDIPLKAELDRLKAQVAGYESYHRQLNEAFNTGDGSYHP